MGNWVKADRAERSEPDSSGLLPLTAAERAELTRLRRENAKLKTEREILKKAAVSSSGQRNRAASLSAGVSKSRVLRGREFSFAAITSRSSWAR